MDKVDVIGMSPNASPASARHRFSRSSILLSLLAGLWVIAVAYGIDVIRTYESTPGAFGLAPQRWPDGSRLVPDADHATLVMLVHPQCSCTRASLAELQHIMSQAQGRLSAWVLFIEPTGMDDGWERSWTLTQAERILNILVNAVAAA
jgi:hypothetical protein